MDFLKILKSFEDFIYEALIWIILLPKTLCRILVKPRKMAMYAAAELGKDDEERFSEEITPPLLLILCVMIAHFIDLGIRQQKPENLDSLSGVILGSEQNFLLYRTIAFGIWALAGAVCFLIHTGAPIGRKNLRVPFYEQCYLVAPFALLTSISSSLILMGGVWENVGAGVACLAAIWFWFVEIDWVRSRTKSPLWRSVVAATLILLTGSLFNAAVGRALAHGRAANDAPVEKSDG